MPIAKVVTAQRDFSAGELDIAAKRADESPIFKAGARQMRNWRILNTKGIANRPGRSALALEGPRVDQVVMTPGNTFFLAFGAGYLRVYDSTFTKRFDSASVPFAAPWTNATVSTVIWDVYRFAVYITFTGMRPLILTWDGVSQTSTWTLQSYVEDLQSSGQKRTIFYRLSPLGITLQPTPPAGGSVNSLTITNAGVFTQVPAVTIGSPGIGVTATATATLKVATAAVSGAGIIAGPNGNVLFSLPNGILILATVSGTAVTAVVSISNAGSLSAGSTPANPVTATGISAGNAMLVAPTFTLTWQLATLALTNSGGSGYTSAPAVSFTPSGGTAAATATISAVGSLNTTLTFSAGMQLTQAAIGTRIRYCNRQILITGVTSSTVATGLIEEQLYSSAIYSTTNNSNFNLFFSIGTEIIGQTSGAKAIVVAISANGLQMTVQFITGTTFIIPEIVVGTGNSLNLTVAVAVQQAPQAVTDWDEEVMNAYRGYPLSCFVDQGRLGFCDFPALPGLIGWSALGDFTDLYTDANNAAPTNAIQELVPGKSRVMYVVPGAEGSEFVFCDNALYYIPINQTTPLQPGSVAFNTLSNDGAAQVKPQRAQQSVIFVSAGNLQLKAVQPVGAYTRPYLIDDITELRSHLLINPVAIAIPGGSTQFEERYIYVTNGDGSLMVGKYNLANGLIDPKTIGWLPWSGNGTVLWASAWRGSPSVLLGSTYAPNGIPSIMLIETIDNTQFLDAAIFYNAVPASMTAPGGKGPLWWLASGAVDLMDNGRMMGTYQIDANGNLVPQNNAGENFTSATLSCGQAWTATLEPFVPAVQPGQDVNQRLRKRRIQRHELYVQNSTGFTMVRFFGGPVTRTSPAIGTVMKVRRIPAWNQDDDPTQPPPLREQSYSDRPTGRLHDPRVGIIKDTPGSLTILEEDLEVSV
jgi:hypothetical protein